MGNNLLDITERLKARKTNDSNTNEINPSEIVNIGLLREEQMVEDRRQVRRTLMTEFVSVHTVVPGYGLLKVMLRDLNDRGLSFELEEARGHFNSGDEVELRIYLNHQTYFKIESKIAHVTHLVEDGIYRHGCEFVNGSINNEALGYFIKFLETVTASLKKDKGDILVSKINS
jgi:hypothetical protein